MVDSITLFDLELTSIKLLRFRYSLALFIHSAVSSVAFPRERLFAINETATHPFDSEISISISVSSSRNISENKLCVEIAARGDRVRVAKRKFSLPVIMMMIWLELAFAESR